MLAQFRRVLNLVNKIFLSFSYQRQVFPPIIIWWKNELRDDRSDQTSREN